MIDAIRSAYSSIHGGREQNRTIEPTFRRSAGYGEDCFAKAEEKESRDEYKSALSLGASIAATCIIANVLMNSEKLLKSDFGALKNSIRAVSVVTFFSAICFIALKSIEKIIGEDN